MFDPVAKMKMIRVFITIVAEKKLGTPPDVHTQRFPSWISR